jgi:D,D-heptose 1,7-bisphosphate phosphatase
MAHNAVFLDRDHTLIEDPGYLADPRAVRLMPGAAAALRRLAQAGYKLVVVTNQSGVARGLLTEDTLQKVHQEMRRQFQELGVALDGVYYCPFHPQGAVAQYTQESDLRKPAPGMLLQAAKNLELDLAGSWMIGDSSRDMEAGRRAGCKTILLRRPAQFDDSAEPAKPDFEVDNMAQAAELILTGQVPPAGQTDPAGQGRVETPQTNSSQAGASNQTSAQPASPPADQHLQETLDRQNGILQQVMDRLEQIRNPAPQFSLLRVLGVLCQIFALLVLCFALTFLPETVRLYLQKSQISPFLPLVTILLLTATVLQMAALAFFVYSKKD